MERTAKPVHVLGRMKNAAPGLEMTRKQRANAWMCLWGAHLISLAKFKTAVGATWLLAFSRHLRGSRHH